MCRGGAEEVCRVPLGREGASAHIVELDHITQQREAHCSLLLKLHPFSAIHRVCNIYILGMTDSVARCSGDAGEVQGMCSGGAGEVHRITSGECC